MSPSPRTPETTRSLSRRWLALCIGSGLATLAVVGLVGWAGHAGPLGSAPAIWSGAIALLALLYACVWRLGAAALRTRTAELAALRHTADGLGLDTRATWPIPPTGDVSGLACSLQAMTERMHGQYATLAETTAIGREILSTIELPQIIRALLKRVPELVRCETAALVVRRRGERTAEVHRRRGGDDPSAFAEAHVDNPTLRRFRRAFRSVGDVLHVTRGHALYDALVAALGQESAAYALFPLFFKRDLVGIVALGLAEDVPLAPADAAHLRQVADLAAVALSNVRMIEEIQFLAYYDELTGLPNRVLCTERLGHALGRARRHDGTVAVLYIDLDHFKRVNDSIGQDHGDSLIRAFSTRLLRALARPDTDGGPRVNGDLARIGGDEFVAVLEDIGDVSEVAHVCRQIGDELAVPFPTHGEDVFLAASIGVALFPHDGDDADSLLKNAHAATRHAKDEGRGDFRFYQESMHRAAAHRLSVENRLRKALDASDVRLCYQPLVNAKTGAVAGVEAVSRWTDSELGEVSPGEFIPIAEEAGLIVALGERTLREACRQLATWEQEGLPRLYVAVNVSVRQFRDRGFVSLVRRIVSESEIGPDQLTLEITESVLMQRTTAALTTLRELRELGIRVAIDDFGTGYSSLSYLKDLPVDCLKIDQTFVRGIGNNREDEAITAAIVALSHILGLAVVAEGVETEDQLRFLTTQGCDVFQGFAFSPPVPPGELAALLRGRGFADHIPAARPVVTTRD